MSGELLHTTTVYSRMNGLGWTARQATQTPVQKMAWRDGRMNIAAAARADKLTPGKVQLLMRDYGVSYEEARDYLRATAH
ncbi:MAG: hypothetical protein CMN61_03370 [Sphingobium sp.]|nr:hypothetical protein [Sphingobium sp.]